MRQITITLSLGVLALNSCALLGVAAEGAIQKVAENILHPRFDAIEYGQKTNRSEILMMRNMMKFHFGQISKRDDEQDRRLTLIEGLVLKGSFK